LKRERQTTHGLSRSNEYSIWRGMVRRCHDPKAKDYDRYGGRGIRVRISFEEFYAEVGARPPGMSIERIENDMDYAAGNLRWATAKEQATNRREPSIAE
jgi:hypothetical protein